LTLLPSGQPQLALLLLMMMMMAPAVAACPVGP
jgi:hypothetical protein